MASFNEFDKEDFVERRNANKRVVYLESDEDLQVFGERWFFDRGEYVDFSVAASEGCGGCNDVIRRVKEDREAGIDAWGVVDRDTLAAHGHWDAFFDCDDSSFASRKMFGDHVLVLRCWEMENYLLHPQAIEADLADANGRAPRATEKILEELFDILCCHLPIVAANLLLTSHGKPSLPKSFGAGESCNKIMDAIQGKLDAVGLGDVLDDCLERIVAFGQQHPQRTMAHWFALLRLVDGKLLVEWLKRYYGLRDECRYRWARSIHAQSLLREMIDASVWNLAYTDEADIYAN